MKSMASSAKPNNEASFNPNPIKTLKVYEFGAWFLTCLPVNDPYLLTLLLKWSRMDYHRSVPFITRPV